jgi:hypothetical protein
MIQAERYGTAARRARSAPWRRRTGRCACRRPEKKAAALPGAADRADDPVLPAGALRVILGPAIIKIQDLNT